MAATLADPLLGHLIDGRYEVLSRIARGGMATVYLATDRRLDREVAIKVMHPHLAEGGAGSEFVARFRREARAAARLTHPGLVGVFDQGVDGETSYLTMEYVDGTNLRRHLAEQGALTLEEAFSTVEAVLEALAAVHRAGLVHRDVKPENILLAADGRIKVADFGLARAVTEITVTTAGTVLGTVAYLAPELVAHGSSDARTDVYATGILLYELVTGVQPFTGSSPIEVAYKHVNSDIPAPSDVVPWLPVEVDELVQGLAARNPDDRPADAAATLRELRRTRAALDAPTLARRADVAPSIALPQATAGHPGEVGRDEVTDEHPRQSLAARPTTVDPVDEGATQAFDVPTRRGAGDPEGHRRGASHLPGGSTVALRIGTVTQEDVPAPGRTGRRGRPVVLLALLALLVAVLAGGGWWYATAGPGAYTSVPDDLVGQDIADARVMLAEAGLDAEPTDVFDAAAPTGTVLSVVPDEGARIVKDGTVDLTVSKGPDLRVVPAGLVGLPVAEARAALETAGFVVPEPERQYDDAVPVDVVVGVSQEGDTQLPVDTEVVLTVSSGPAPLTIPGVLGVPKDEAIAALTAVGLVVNADAVGYSDEHPAGTVMAQDPVGGAAGFRTGTVTLTISQGPPLVAVPDVFSTQFDQAKATLEGLGLVVVREDLLGGVFGTVRNQSVAPGAMVPQGTQITLTVV